MRGRKPKPQHLRAIDGGADHRAAAVPQPSGMAAVAVVPDPPDWLQGEALEEWDRVVPELHQAGLMTTIYRGPVAAYCQAYGRWVEAERSLRETGALLVKTPNGYPVMSPLLAIANRAMEQMRQFATEFGMTPSSLARATRVDAQGDLFNDPLEALLNGGRGG